MNIVVWAVTGVLALAYSVGGLAMLLLPKARLRSLGDQLHYVDDFDEGFIKALGAVKLVAVTGLLLPPLVDTATQLTAWAALGLVLVMTGATTVRIVRKEWRFAAGDLALFAMAGFVAYERFGPQAFGA
jgi:predicted permease